MKRTLILLFVLVATFCYATDPVVENVRLEQRTDGSLIVDIFYDVTDAEGDTVEVSVEASSDNGDTWTLTCQSLFGDVGTGISPGIGKQIIWDFYKDNPNVSGTGYKVRIVANDHNDKMFDIDGNVYKTVKIGNQVWMAENLRVTHFRNGEPITNIVSNTSNPGWWYAWEPGYCDCCGQPEIYGNIYNWYAVSDSQNIAPEGWHVPTDEEWKELEQYLGMSQEESDAMARWRGTNEGGKLKSMSVNWNSPNVGATNESGFSAEPGGDRIIYYGGCSGPGGTAYFWSATAKDNDHAWYRYLSSGSSMVFRTFYDKRFGYSVRLIRD